MKKIVRLPGIFSIAFVLFIISCKKSDDVLPGSNIPIVNSVNPDEDVLLSRVYINNHISRIFLYNTNNQIKTIYNYVPRGPVNNTSNDYEYSSDGRVYKEISHYIDTPKVRETFIKYSMDSVFYTYKGAVNSEPVIKSNRSIYRGNRDTIYPLAGFNTVLRYTVYEVLGNDLSTFKYKFYFKNSNMQYDDEFEESYTYDTTINPLWPILKNNDPFFTLKLSDATGYETDRPFAFSVSKHNPLKVTIAGDTSIVELPKGATFKYKLLPGSLYPTECVWINNQDGSIYATYKYEYIKAN